MNSLLVEKHESSGYFEMLLNPSDPEMIASFFFCRMVVYQFRKASSGGGKFADIAVSVSQEAS